MAGDDRRGSARKRVLKGATIAFNNRCSTQTCVVRDLSETGARLRVQPGQFVPDEFDLVIDVDGFEAACSVSWRKAEEIGVIFTSPPTRNASRRPQVVTAIARERPSLRRKPPVS
jgi:hypothetical protein